MGEDELEATLNVLPQEGPYIEGFSVDEICRDIKKLNPRKAPGYDLITGLTLKNLPSEGIIYLAHLFNAILRACFSSPQWKVAQIIMISKAGKPSEDLKSYRPISLLPVTAKLFETVYLPRLMLMIEESRIIPDHQFGFKVKRLGDRMYRSFESRK